MSENIQALLDDADSLLQSGSPHLALPYLQRAFADSADNPRFHVLLGECHLGMNRPDLALDAFTEAARLDPESATIENNRCVAFLALGRFEEAIACGERAIALAPDDADARFNLGMAYANRADWQQAEPHLRYAAQKHPAIPDFQEALVTTLLHLRRWEEAGCALDALRSPSDAPQPAAPHLNLRRFPDTFTPQDFAQWLPARVKLHPQDTFVEWQYAGDMRLDDPFFLNSLERLEAAYPHYPRLQTDLSIFEAFAESADTLRPDGFIFHLGRCGSTLVSNALRAIAGTISLSEPGPLMALLWPYEPELWPYSREEWEAKRGQLFRGGVAAYGQKRCGDERRYFLKFSNWNVLRRTFIKTLWPEVPCLFLYRDPVEVMASHLAFTPTWLEHRLPAEFVGLRQEEAETMSTEEYIAYLLGRFCHAATPSLDDKTALLRYDELGPESLYALFRFFGVDESEVDAATLAPMLTTHAKDPSKLRPFVPDGEAKRRQLSAYAREMVDKHIATPYAELERLRPSYPLTRVMQANSSLPHSSPE